MKNIESNKKIQMCYKQLINIRKDNKCVVRDAAGSVTNGYLLHIIKTNKNKC